MISAFSKSLDQGEAGCGTEGSEDQGDGWAILAQIWEKTVDRLK